MDEFNDAIDAIAYAGTVAAGGIWTTEGAGNITAYTIPDHYTEIQAIDWNIGTLEYAHAETPIEINGIKFWIKGVEYDGIEQMYKLQLEPIDHIENFNIEDVLKF